MKLSRWGALLALVVLASLAGRLYVISQSGGLWWDEAVYLGLGRALSSYQYTLEPGVPLESFRPPVTPLVISSFYWSADYARCFVALISIFSVLAVYRLGRDALGETGALFAAAFTATSHLFVFFSSKIMSEPIFIVLFSHSMIMFSSWSRGRDKKDLFLCGALAGAAFMTRYLAYVLVLAYIVYFLSPLARKRMPEFRPLAALLSGFILSLIPWFWIGQAYYGNPVGAFVTNFNIWTFSFAQTLLEGLHMLASSLNYAWVFLAFGLFVLHSKRRRRNPALMVSVLVLVISLAFFLGSGHKEPRYLLSFFPAYALLAGLGAREAMLNGRWKKLAVAAVCVLSVTSLAYGLSMAWEDRDSASGLYQAALFLEGKTGPGESVLTQSYPYVYLVGRKAVPYCENYIVNDAWEACQAQIIARTWEATAVLPLLEKHNITYVLSYKFELMNPARTIAYFDREFEKVKSWGQWGEPEAVVVYRANQTGSR